MDDWRHVPKGAGPATAFAAAATTATTAAAAATARAAAAAFAAAAEEAATGMVKDEGSDLVIEELMSRSALNGYPDGPLLAAAVRPAECCLPRHRLPFNSRNKSSRCVG